MARDEPGEPIVSQDDVDNMLKAADEAFGEDKPTLPKWLYKKIRHKKFGYYDSITLFHEGEEYPYGVMFDANDEESLEENWEIIGEF